MRQIRRSSLSLGDPVLSERPGRRAKEGVRGLEILKLNLEHPSEDVQREALAALSALDPAYRPAYDRALAKQQARRKEFRAQQEH